MILSRDLIFTAIEERLSEREVLHCARSEVLAVTFAKAHGIDEDMASAAGLLHDFARALPHPVLLSEARRFGLEISDVDRSFPYLLHGPVGAELVRQDLGIDNQEVIDAIASHTLGSAPMSRLSAIAFLSDHLEEGRGHEYAHGLVTLAKKDLWAATKKCMAEVMGAVLRSGKQIHPRSLEAWNSIASKAV